MPAIAGAFSLVTWKSCLAAIARSMNSFTPSNCERAASEGSARKSGRRSGSSASSCSPYTCRAARLLATALTSGQA